MAKDKRLFIDLMFNRINFMASKAGSATFVCKDGIVQCKEGGLEFILGTDTVWEVPADSSWGPDKSPVWRANLAEVPEIAMKMMEEMSQAGELEFGVISAADGSANDLNSSGTATGVGRHPEHGQQPPERHGRPSRPQLHAHPRNGRGHHP